MARDTMTYESYEPDSFDNPPKGPVGVHRGARSVMARLCPFIVVILVAALCGVGEVHVLCANRVTEQGREVLQA